jgi:type IV secretion system protein VirB7
MSKLRTASKFLSALLALQAVAGCAALADGEPPICDGRNRRPANPYGSILVPAPTPVGEASPPLPAAPDITPPQSSAMGGCA